MLKVLISWGNKVRRKRWSRQNDLGFGKRTGSSQAVVVGGRDWTRPVWSTELVPGQGLMLQRNPVLWMGRGRTGFRPIWGLNFQSF